MWYHSVSLFCLWNREIWLHYWKAFRHLCCLCHPLLPFCPFWPKCRKQWSWQQFYSAFLTTSFPFIIFLSCFCLLLLPKSFCCSYWHLEMYSQSRTFLLACTLTNQIDKCRPSFSGQAFKKKKKEVLHNPQDMRITHQNNHGYPISAALPLSDCFFPIPIFHTNVSKPVPNINYMCIKPKLMEWIFCTAIYKYAIMIRGSPTVKDRGILVCLSCDVLWSFILLN